MQQEELLTIVKAQQEKIDKIYKSVEQTRKYFLWTLIITVILFIVPLIGLAFVIPTFINTYTTNLQNAGL